MEARFNLKHLRLDNVTRHLSNLSNHTTTSPCGEVQGTKALCGNLVKLMNYTPNSYFLFRAVFAAWNISLAQKYRGSYLHYNISTTCRCWVLKINRLCRPQISRGVGRKCTRQPVVCGCWNVARYWVSYTGEVMEVNRSCRACTCKGYSSYLCTNVKNALIYLCFTLKEICLVTVTIRAMVSTQENCPTVPSFLNTIQESVKSSAGIFSESVCAVSCAAAPF